jgi:hypothetical protein
VYCFSFLSLLDFLLQEFMYSASRYLVALLLILYQYKYYHVRRIFADRSGTKGVTVVSVLPVLCSKRDYPIALYYLVEKVQYLVSWLYCVQPVHVVR